MAILIGSPVKAVERVRARVLQEAAEAVDKVADDTRKKFETAVRSWKNRARFIKRPVTSGEGVIRQQVIAQGSPKVIAIFGYVDQGTEPHLIFPKKAKVLAFNAGYSARTSPVANANSGTGKASGGKVFSRGVLHPGSEARDFSGYYALEAQDDLTNELKQRLRQLGRRRL